MVAERNGTVTAALIRAADAYRNLRETAGNYTPYAVRAVELLLAAGLTIGLVYWLYLFVTFDPGPP